MKWVKLAFAFFLLLGAGISSVAWARGPHVGIAIGVPLGSPWYYPPPYYYYPAPVAPVVVAPSAPPVYVEQGASAAPEQPQANSNYWYYCSSPDGYYPYIKQCPGGWKRVAPEPPPQS
jgi:hypothetical protein